jgi:hypothetical protein
MLVMRVRRSLPLRALSRRNAAIVDGFARTFRAKPAPIGGFAATIAANAGARWRSGRLSAGNSH